MDLLALTSWFSFGELVGLLTLIHLLLNLALFTRRLRSLERLRWLIIILLPFFGLFLLFFVILLSKEGNNTVKGRLGGENSSLRKMFLSLTTLVLGIIIFFSFSGSIVVDGSNKHQERLILTQSKEGVKEFAKELANYVNLKNYPNLTLEIIAEDLVHVKPIVPMQIMRGSEFIEIKAVRNLKVIYRIVIINNKAFVEKL